MPRTKGSKNRPKTNTTNDYDPRSQRSKNLLLPLLQRSHPSPPTLTL